MYSLLKRIFVGRPLFREGVVVTSLPYHLKTGRQAGTRTPEPVSRRER